MRVKYLKPSVEVVGCAVGFVRGGGKPLSTVQDSDNSGSYMTIHAYEADE